MPENKNDLIPLVEKLMTKNEEKIKAIQAENFVDLTTHKNELSEEMQKVTKAIGDVQKNIEVIETKMVKNNLKGGPNIKSAIHDNLRSEDYKNALKEHKSKGRIDFSFETDLVRNAVILQPTNFISGDAPVVLPMREIGVDKAPVRPPTVSDIIQWGTTTSNMVDWIERTGKTDGAAMRAEGSVMGEGDLEYTEVSTKVKIASEYMKVTNEALKDVDFLASEINSELLSDLRLLVDTQLLEGDGLGNNLKGILSYASAWAAGTFAGTIDAPNEADVLRIGINKIVVDGKGKWWPSYILLNPDDVTAMDLLRDSSGDYLYIPFYDPEAMTLKRVPVMENVGINAGEFLIGDFSKAKAFVRDALTIRIFDQNEDDPIYNRSTVTANVRLAFRIKNQEAGAFVKGDFATAIAALTTTP